MFKKIPVPDPGFKKSTGLADFCADPDPDPKNCTGMNISVSSVN